MTKVVRTFLMWIVLFALPIQGMAQVNMFACHLSGDVPDAVHVMDHGGMDHDSMIHADTDHSGHGIDSHDQVSSDHSKKFIKSLHGCCNCAPTCAVVLLPVAQLSFASIQHEALHPVSTPQILHSADTRRIDRPPKTLAI